jgi:tetratricopeptide (TPR) repeat protein
MKTALAGAALCLVLLVPFARSIHPVQELAEDQDALVHSTLSPTFLRALAMGFRAAGSDSYWLGVIQYYGTRSSEKHRYRGMTPLLEVTTDLDEKFDYPYQFAGQSLPYHDVDSDLWYNTDSAIALLQKGVAAGVTRWQVPWLLGYCLYTYRGDYAEAGKAILMASKMPRAAAYLGELATRLLAQGDQTEIAIETTTQALAQAEDVRTHADLETRLNALLLQQALEKIERRLEARRAAGLPETQDLAEAMGPEGLPTDPFGGHFSIDAKTGKARSSSEDRLLRIHVHPGSPPVEKTYD